MKKMTALSECVVEPVMQTKNVTMLIL